MAIKRFQFSFLLFFSASISVAQPLPCDPGATKETINLYRNLKRLANKGFLFGHQDDLAYGVHWKYEKGRSDINDVVKDYPAVFGWEIGRIEIDKPVNLDSVPFDKMRGYIEQAYNKGSVITISWHLNNPLTGKSAWDPAPGTVASVLPGGEKNALFTSWLDKVAAFFESLKGRNGELIPIIFRPFHELNGSWFWWGGKNATPQELISLYRFTVSYLRDVKNVHHLLYAYNTDRFATKEEYLQRYPGDEFVDVVGFDIYQKGDILSNDKFIAETDRSLSDVESIAAEKNKIAALTEFGYNKLPDSTWWTNVFYRALDHHHITYALAWRNAGYKSKENNYEYYVPFKGEKSEADFIKFYNLDATFFEKDAAKEKLYQ
jgi:glycosyl hydrolase family 26